jgi:hypothetical protein
MPSARGLVCAGGEATRLGEVTWVANKHLLPLGRWPMIYIESGEYADYHEAQYTEGLGEAPRTEGSEVGGDS